MGKYIELRFGKSSSRNYPKALELAKNFDDFTEIGENSSVNIIKTNSEEIYHKQKYIDNLSYLIRGWQSTKVLYQGNEINWIEFFEPHDKMLHCYRGYHSSITKETHCNAYKEQEGWGCKFLYKIVKHYSGNIDYRPGYEYWYNYGSFETENNWKINKSRIKELLKREAESNLVIHCPIFSFDTVFKRVDELPDNILVHENSDWEVVYKDDFYGSTIQKKAIGIKPKPKAEELAENIVSDFSFTDLIGTRIADLKDLVDKGVTIQGLKDLVKEKDKEEDNQRKRFIPEITYDDIGGIDGIIDKIREVVELPLKRPDLYLHLGIKPHKGILLYGDPGNGKTLVAKAIANEVKAHFIPVSGSELISKYIGESEENLREVFEEAREKKPSIIFFDEIDSVAQRRSNDDLNRHEAKFVNQLLTLMDGMEDYDNVTVLASTNRPELLDEALLRPGRFDFKIEIHKPDEKGCLKILKIKTQKMPLDVSLDLNQVVPMLIGCSGAEITFIVKEAGLNALKRSVNIIDLITEGNYTNLDPKNIHVTFVDFKRSVEKFKDNSL